MRASFCIPKRDPQAAPQTIRRLGRLGYDGVELWDLTIETHGAAALGAWCREAGLAVVQVCPYFDFATSERTAAESLKVVERYVGLAAALDCPRVRTFTNPMRAFASGMAVEASVWRRVARALKVACRIAAPQGIEMCLECHHGDGQLCDSTPAVLRMLNEVEEPNLTVNLQPPLLGEDPLESAGRLAPVVKHLHAHNWIGGWQRLTFLDSGDVDFERFVSILRREGGFDGAISIEHAEHHPLWETAEHEIAYLRPLIARLEQLPGKGLDHGGQIG